MAEREAIAKEKRRAMSCTRRRPNADDLKSVYESIAPSAAASAGDLRFVHHGRAHRPSMISSHGTAVRVNQEAADSKKAKQQVDQLGRPPSPPPPPSPTRESVAMAATRPEPTASLRSQGSVTWQRPPPDGSGIRQALKSCYAKGGRLSAASIPASRTSQQALEAMKEIAATPGPEFTMLVPDQYHTVRRLLQQERVVEAHALVQAAEERARLAALKGMIRQRRRIRRGRRRRIQTPRSLAAAPAGRMDRAPAVLRPFVRRRKPRSKGSCGPPHGEAVDLRRTVVAAHVMERVEGRARRARRICRVGPRGRACRIRAPSAVLILAMVGRILQRRWRAACMVASEAAARTRVVFSRHSTR